MTKNKSPAAGETAREAGDDQQAKQNSATAPAPQAEVLTRPHVHARLLRLLAGRARVIFRGRDGGPAIVVALDDGRDGA